MIIRSKKDPSEGWTIIHNGTVEDDSLPWDALGLLTYILRKPDNWTISVEHLASLRGAGRDKIKRMLRDLESAGYLQRTKGRNERGHWDWTRTIYDRSQGRQTSISDESSSNGNATDGKSGNGSASDGKAGSGKRTENAVSGDSATNGSAVNGSPSDGSTSDGKAADITTTDITTTSTTPPARAREDNSSTNIDPVAYLEDRWQLELASMQSEDVRTTVTDRFQLWRNVVDRFRRQDKAKRHMLHYALQDYKNPSAQDLPNSQSSTNGSQSHGAPKQDAKHDPEAAYRETLAIFAKDS